MMIRGRIPAAYPAPQELHQHTQGRDLRLPGRRDRLPLRLSPTGTQVDSRDVPERIPGV